MPGIFEEAVAEAKAVKDAAIAQAKQTLEESLTPHLKDMISAKLQEMESEEDEFSQEEGEDLPIEGEMTYESEEEAPVEGEEEMPVDGGEEEAPAEEDVDLADLEMDEFKELVRSIVSDIESEGESEIEDVDGEDEGGAEAEVDALDASSEEEIDIDEIMRELDESDTELKEDTVEEEVSEEDEDTVEEEVSSVVKERDKYRAQLKEAYKAVSKLQSDLHEVNVLNAKLLYLNRLLKVNNLTESDKANLVSVFDKAETIKEVKLVYETVSVNMKQKSPVTESAKPKVIKSMASDSKGATKTIKESKGASVDPNVLRLQRLAGIIKD